MLNDTRVKIVRRFRGGQPPQKRWPCWFSTSAGGGWRLLELAALLSLSQQCAPSIAPATMLSVVKVESGFNPLAINVNGAADPPPPKDRSEAIRMAEGLIRQGHSVDLGLGQINSRNLGWLGLSVAEAFDPCRNLAAAAKVLEQGFVGAARSAPQQQALRMAFSAYNTGDYARGFRNGYVAKVEAAAAGLALDLDGASSPTPRPSPAELAEEISAENLMEVSATAANDKPTLDVFARTAASAVHVFGR